MRDVSKIISEAEFLKLQQLLKAQPDVAVGGPYVHQEYPKMLYRVEWLQLQRLIESHPDPVIVKQAKEKMRQVLTIVHDFEEEEDLLLDGWKSDPNEFIIAADGKDPRIPVGKEGRRSARENRLSKDAEIEYLKRRYAELTASRLSEAVLDASQPASEPEPLELEADEPATTFAKRRQAAKPVDKRAAVRAAAVRSVSAHV